jgi:hypothetical protein
MCPLYQVLAGICDGVKDPHTHDETCVEDAESYENRVEIRFHTEMTIEDKILQMKDKGRQYSADNLRILLKYINRKNITNSTTTTKIEKDTHVRKLLSEVLTRYPGHPIFLKIYNMYLSGVKDIAVLQEATEKYKTHECYEFFYRHKTTHFDNQILFWRNVIRCFVKVFGSQIQNKCNQRLSMMFDNEEIEKKLTKINESGSILVDIVDNTAGDDPEFCEQLFLFYFFCVVVLIEETATKELLMHYISLMDVPDHPIVKKPTVIQEISDENAHLLSFNVNSFILNQVPFHAKNNHCVDNGHEHVAIDIEISVNEKKKRKKMEDIFLHDMELEE